MLSPETGPIAVIGGTGALGGGIARRLLRARLEVILGSRDAARASAAAAQLTEEIGSPARGTDNLSAARDADIVVVAVPFASQSATLTELAPVVEGKIVIDTTVPLIPPRVTRVQLPPEGSAAGVAQKILGGRARQVFAFHNVSARKLAGEGPVDCDVLVFSDDKGARELTIDLANACGLRGVDGGALVNSAAAEALTSVLIWINKTYAVEGAGIRITGLRPPSELNMSTDERRHDSQRDAPEASSVDRAGFDPARFCRRFLSQGYNGSLQLRYVSNGDDCVVLAAPSQPELLKTNDEMVADGALITLLDMTGTLAVWTRLGRFRPHATLDLRIDHLATIPPDTEISSSAECYHLTQRIAYVRGQASTGDGTLIAMLSATYAFTDQP
jgi:8-hydroxy-5-deazaflavin:NADPH oxidoreductase